MTDDQRRAAEKRLEEMAVDLKGIAEQLNSTIMFSVYRDKHNRDSYDVNLHITYNTHRFVDKTWFSVHKRPYFRGLINKLENMIHRP